MCNDEWTIGYTTQMDTHTLQLKYLTARELCSHKVNDGKEEGNYPPDKWLKKQET